MKNTGNPLLRVYRFYVNGFREMTWGRTLWLIILIKLFIMFAVLRAFFFQPALAGKSTEEKQQHVATNLSNR